MRRCSSGVFALVLAAGVAHAQPAPSTEAQAEAALAEGRRLVEELEVEGSNSFPPRISADECESYLTSNRAGGQGAFDLYRARRPGM